MRFSDGTQLKLFFLEKSVKISGYKFIKLDLTEEHATVGHTSNKRLKLVLNSSPNSFPIDADRVAAAHKSLKSLHILISA